ncbi:hypothetical protein ACJX0J_029133, partial [Zea mays]
VDTMEGVIEQGCLEGGFALVTLEFRVIYIYIYIGISTEKYLITCMHAVCMSYYEYNIHSRVI